MDSTITRAGPISDEAWPVIAVEGVLHRLKKLEYEHEVDGIKWTFDVYRKENPKGYEIWRQLYIEGLTVAMLQLAENLPEHVKREVSSCCSTAILKEACGTSR